MNEDKIIFKISGKEYKEGNWYKDDNKKLFMIVRASRW